MRRLKYAGSLAVASILLCSGVGASDSPGVPFGSAFQIETSAGLPAAPDVASNARGDFAVAWENVAVSPATVLVRGFSAFGEPFSDEVDLGAGIDPAVAMDATDNVVVVFNRAGQLRYALFDGGALVKADVVDADPSVSAARPSVAMNADGAFVVSYVKTVGTDRVAVVREFGANGVQIDDVVAPFAAGSCETPVVAISAGGRFVVACVVGAGANRSVQAQAYDAFAAPAGGVVKANALDAPDLTGLHAAMDGSGRFVLAWSLGNTQINGRFFGPNGGALGGEFTVVADPDQGVEAGDVAMSADGATVITWDTRGQGAAQTSGSDVFERRYDKTGAATATRKVNAGPRPHLHQLAPSVALDADGDFVVVWQDGDTAQGTHVLGQRFVGPENVDLSLDITDSPDPVNGGAQLTYLFNVTNLHPVATPIAGNSPGIDAVNSAIGTAHEVEITATLPAGSGSFIQGGSADWGPCGFNATTSTLHCVYQEVLAPGETTTVTSRRGAATHGSTSTATGEVAAYQFDDRLANNSDTETTALAGNPATVQFALGSSSVGETDADVTKHVTVTLSAPVNQDVTVAFAATGTATSPADYTLPASPLTIPAGQLSADIVVTVKGDEVPEGAETVVLQLSSPSAGAELGTPATHTLTITDDEPLSVQFHAASESAPEEDGEGVPIQVDLSSPSAEDVTVNFAVSGTATPSTDYTIEPANGTLTIPAGEQHATITITPLDDEIDEVDETAVLTLTSATNAAVGPNATNTLTIVDDEAATVPQIQFQTAPATVTEGDQDVVVTVALTQPTTVPVTAHFTIGGSADGNDIALVSPASGIVSIDAGATTGTITLHVRNDLEFEETETVLLTLTEPEGATLGSPSTFTLTILDNDAGGIGSNSITIQSAAAGKEVTFTTSQGRFSALSLDPDPPNNPPAGVDYPLGFFDYVIGNVAANTALTLTIDVPEGSGITDLILCLDNSCFRVPKNASPVPGQVDIEGDQIKLIVQDQGPADNDVRPGFVSAKVAPARPQKDSGGSMGWLLLAPLFGAALARRRRLA